MGTPGLIVVFALGSAALALWVYTRYPKAAPETFRGAVVHVALAILMGQLAILLMGRVAVDPAGIMLSLFTLAIPALVYSFLACLWMFRVCQQMLGGALR
jgi:hypothetical protein